LPRLALRAAIEHFAAAEGFKISGEYAEYETGKALMLSVEGRNWLQRSLQLGPLSAAS
jgi:hypothetical protein